MAAAQPPRPPSAPLPETASPADPAAPEATAADAPITGFELLAGGTLDVRWITAEDDAVGAPPALDESSAYVPMRSGRMVAIDLDSGRTRWSVESETDRTPAVGGGRVYLTMSGGVRALDAASGRVVWQRALPAPAVAPPYWDTGWLLVSVEGGDLVALRAEDGEPLWQSPLGAALQVAPAPALDALYLGLADGRVVAVALASGAPLWSRQLDGVASGVSALDDQVIVGTTARAVHSLDLRTGGTRWRWRVGGPVIGVAAADEHRIYVVAFDHLLRALDRRTGNLRWRRALPHRPAGSPQLVGTMVLVPSLSSELSAYRVATGEPALAIASAGEVAGETRVRSGGAVAGTRLLAVSVEGRLLAFAPRVEPAPVPLAAHPGVAVDEPPLDQPPPALPPPGARERR